MHTNYISTVGIYSQNKSVSSGMRSVWLDASGEQRCFWVLQGLQTHPGQAVGGWMVLAWNRSLRAVVQNPGCSFRVTWELLKLPHLDPTLVTLI